MESRQELRASDGEGNRAGAPDENNFTRHAAAAAAAAENKHAKARPTFVDVGRAQDYRASQDLPSVNCAPIESESDSQSSETGYIPVMLDDDDIAADRGGWRSARATLRAKKRGDEFRFRDRVTGRMLARYGRSCLRCTEQGLRCTLNFAGAEREAQCAACRRSGARYCVRFDSRRAAIPFRGPEWENPNFVAGTSGRGVPELEREELRRILREFHDGPPRYVLGVHVTTGDAHRFALPPFNGAEKPPGERPEGYESMDWRDVLPVWRNRSLRPRRPDWENHRERESREGRVAFRRRERGDEGEGEGEGGMMMDWGLGGGETAAATRQVASGDGGGDEQEESDWIRYLRSLRKYQPREQHLCDVLGETW
ncbi:hypothetical protein F5Y14DRAFT_290549 [Nemania sp. NC0429]|nr:hypothetical protein F5Y14DRAFT_290549 [Nemania sp. NC0429]